MCTKPITQHFFHVAFFTQTIFFFISHFQLQQGGRMGAWVVAIGVVVSLCNINNQADNLPDGCECEAQEGKDSGNQFFCTNRFGDLLCGAFFTTKTTYIFKYSTDNHRRHGITTMIERILQTPSQKKNQNHGIKKRKRLLIRRNWINNSIHHGDQPSFFE